MRRSPISNLLPRASSATRSSSWAIATVVAATSLVLPWLAGCGEATEQADDTTNGEQQGATTGTLSACEALPTSGFISVGLHEVGLCADDSACLGRWRVSFANGRFEYSQSDFTESGTFECHDGVVTGTVYDRQYSGSFDLQAGELTWDGRAFIAEPERIATLGALERASGCADMTVFAASSDGNVALMAAVRDSLVATAHESGAAVQRTYVLPNDAVTVVVDVGARASEPWCNDALSPEPRIVKHYEALSGTSTVLVEPTGEATAWESPADATIIINDVLLFDAENHEYLLIPTFSFDHIAVGWLPG